MFAPLLPGTALAGSSAWGGHVGGAHRGLFRPVASAKRQPQRQPRWRPIASGAHARYTRSREALVNEVAWPRGAISPRLVGRPAVDAKPHNFRPDVRRQPPAKARVTNTAMPAQRRATPGTVFRPAAGTRKPSYERMVANRYPQLPTRSRYLSGYSAAPVYTPYWLGH